MALFGNASKAARRYTRRLLVVMTFYVLAVLAVTRFVHAHHPTGWKLWLMCALPTIPIVAMLGVIGLYLKEETDEFKRMMITRSMLCATAVTLALTAFDDFMRSYGGANVLQPFTTFVTFFIVMGLVEGIQSVMNRVKDDE
jgi:cytochrome bd-type quinol oxidase subunit 2